MILNFNFLPKYVGMILQGCEVTLILVVSCLILGFGLGLVFALFRQSSSKFLRGFSSVWVNVLRNTPFLLQLFFFFYGLPQLGISTTPLVTSIIALSINSSAPNCEVIRSGLMSVKKGYYECAYSLGYSKFQTFVYFIIPISLRLSFKSLVNNFVNLALTSSVCYSTTLMEITGVAKTVVGRVSRPFEVYLLILVLYCVFTYVISFISKAIDRKIHIVL